MGSDMQELLSVFAVLLGVGVGLTLLVLFFIFVAVPLFRGVGKGVGFGFNAIGWFFSHIFEFIGGMLSDLVRFVGALIAMLVLMLLVPLNIVIGRWSAAGHFAEGVKRECHVGSACVYRALIRRPLKLVLLHGLLEGIEQRVPEAMLAAPTADQPSKRTGQFDGYTILGSLKAGGSGAKLYVAEPADDKRNRHRYMPDRVVIKSFAITEGSSLPQIVRESRALECAKQLGHVLDHGMDEHRFYYVMPYHPGDHLGILTRQLHGESGGRGLEHKQLSQVMSYTRDLLCTLSAYHKGGLWHKDVKPENVIIHDGRAHLVDLGLVTPLKSAMTLTTHGTEYFRDPEMVRQALRGVKVHQVDGAKFDIYAAGAVLYFMIENTFPAHGGLSRFVAKSPESLRWIIRRAMTEYNQRYATADEMLRDVQYVLSASDAFAVKPADLPSMNGGADYAPEDEPEMFAAAGSPQPQPVAFQGYGVAAGIGEQGTFAQVGKFQLDENGEPVGQGSKPRWRPRLAITNWWTGEYAADPAPQVAAANAQHAFHVEATRFRHQAQEIGRQARAGAISARTAAREQIKAARERAKDLRRRAHERRIKIGVEPRGNQWAMVIGALSILFLGAILALSFLTRGGSSSLAAGSRAHTISRNLPVLLAVDYEGAMTDSLRKQIKEIIKGYTSKGYGIVEDANDLPKIMPVIRKWREEEDEESDRQIEEYLAANDAYGVVYVGVENSRRGRPTVKNQLFVYSTDPAAQNRTGMVREMVPPAPAHSYLIINDHPAKLDLAVSAEIERRLRQYRDAGWQLVSDDEREVQIRSHVTNYKEGDKLSPMLHSLLAEHALGGVMLITGTAGNEPAMKRVQITRVARDYSIAAPLSPDVPVAPVQP